MRFILALTLFTATVSAFVAVNSRDLSALKADIVTMTTLATKLDNDVNAYPNSGGTLAGALAIHTDSTNLDNAVKQGTIDAPTEQLSETDGQDILASMTTLVAIIKDALNGLIAKKAAFGSLPLGGISTIILNDMKTLQGDLDNFLDVLIAIAPDDLKDDFEHLKLDEVDPIFEEAIAAYS